MQLDYLSYFIVKITFIHETNFAIENDFAVTTSYDDYDVYHDFKKHIIKVGWDVIVFVPNKKIVIELLLVMH